MGLIFPNHSGRNLYAALVRRCMHKGLEVFYYLNLKDRTLPYSRTLCRALPCPHFLYKGPKKCLHLLPTVFLRNSTERVDPPPFVLATSPKDPPRQELPGDDRGSNPPAVAGRLFSFTIRPGRLSLPSVAYEFTSIPGRVQFPFDLSLVAVTRIRASVSTPPKLT